MTKNSQTRARLHSPASLFPRHSYAAPFSSEKHADTQLFNRINSLAAIASQPILKPFNRMSHLETVASKLSPQNLCRFTQKTYRFTQKLCS